jgi:hypothetical protein
VQDGDCLCIDYYLVWHGIPKISLQIVEIRSKSWDEFKNFEQPQIFMFFVKIASKIFDQNSKCSIESQQF